MSNSNMAWVPSGLPPALARALSVPHPGKTAMTRDLYLSLLESKLGRLIQENPQEAQQAMEMSLEQVPEMYAIAQSQPPTAWATAIVQSDSLMPVLAKVSVANGTQELQQPQSLMEILELLP